MNDKESLLSMYEADAEQAYMSKTPFMKLPGDYERMLYDQEQHRLEKERRAAAQTPTLTAEQLHKDPTYQRLAEHLWNAYGQGDARLPSYMTSKFGMPSKGKSSPQDKAEWLSQKLGTFNNSLSGMMIDLSKMKDAPFSDLKAFNDALKMYDASDTTVIQGVRAVALNAAEIFMFGGLGFIAGKAIAKGLGKNVVMSRLQNIVNRAGAEIKRRQTLTGATLGSIEGGVYGGGLTAGREEIAHRAEDRPFDPTNPAVGTAAGIGLGGLLGGLGGYAGKKFSRGNE
jgi:hypothetical protein